MPRDQILKKTFEITDDGMQGVIGYFFYVSASQHISNDRIIRDYLPKVLTPKNGSFEIQFIMQMFHEWGRYYDPKELVQTMGSVFTPYHIRTCLIGIVSIFESYLSNSIDRLVKKGLMRAIADSYKQRLNWAFSVILSSRYGNAQMQNRLPQLCLDLDHARRIRNLWMHNNGNFTRRYKSDVLNIPNCNPIIVPEYQRFIRSPKSKVPFPADITLFETISRSHVEALHHIHNMLQVQFFGQKRWYGYKLVKKRIEWRRVLFGV